MNNPDIQDALRNRLIERLTKFAKVDDAWHMPPLDNLYSDTPGAFVYLHADGAAGDSEPVTLCPRQRITMVYGVYMVLPGDQFVARTHDVREALFGWVPSEHHEPMAMRAGERINVQQIASPFIEYRQLWSVDSWLMSRETE